MKLPLISRKKHETIVSMYQTDLRKLKWDLAAADKRVNVLINNQVALTAELDAARDKNKSISNKIRDHLFHK